MATGTKTARKAPAKSTPRKSEKSAKRAPDKPEIGALREEDLATASELTYRSINHIRGEHGLAPIENVHKGIPKLLEHIYSQNPELNWGAYDGDRLVGFASSHIRDRHWHMAYLFVDPSHQGLGIGRGLLRGGIAAATERQMFYMSQCTFAYNARAIGLFSKLGMFPRKAILSVTRDLSDGWEPGGVPPALIAEPITSTQTLNALGSMDREIRGINRSVDHCYWLAHDDYTGFVFRMGAQNVGYAYISNRGQIGPVLVTRDNHLVDVIKHCLQFIITSKCCKQAKLYVTGKNFALIQYLSENGFRFGEVALLMTNRVFCDMKRYLPASLALY